ncbi:hypothetical protein PIB30_044362 [Stylosanthes scabra]|uniref:Uncharacterized protein n=1 Tax=Stylosanthes scabra TaxID=79078 RepID=A0ABU6TFG9_9FABA|nr:hypothetical protein [Stylosanthes scabra]
MCIAHISLNPEPGIYQISITNGLVPFLLIFTANSDLSIAMASHPRFPFPSHLHLHRSSSSSSLVLSPPSSFDFPALKLRPLPIRQHSSSSPRHLIHTSTRAFDDDSFDMPPLEEWSHLDDYENFPPPAESYVMSSSDGEDTDGDAFLTPVNDLELPSVSSSNHNDSITLAAHRFATLSREHKKHRQDQTWHDHYCGSYNSLDGAALVCRLVCVENC